MKKQKNKAAQTLGRMSHKYRTEGMTKKEISAYYQKISHKRKIYATKTNEDQG